MKTLEPIEVEIRRTWGGGIQLYAWFFEKGDIYEGEYRIRARGKDLDSPEKAKKHFEQFAAANGITNYKFVE